MLSISPSLKSAIKHLLVSVVWNVDHHETIISTA